MKNAYEVLKHKEAELARVRKEVESLRLVAPLLANDPETEELLYSSPTTRRSLYRFGPANGQPKKDRP
jgi:hypothetical protein